MYMKANLQALLKPVSLLYELGVGVRNAAYDKGLLVADTPSLPVICVGNVVVGGSGKTPFSHYLVELLSEMGRKPALLSRGYGGRIKGPHVVAMTDGYQDVGDEVVLHRRILPSNLPVVISKKRILGINLLAKQGDVDVVVMDDGLQHRQMERRLNFLMVGEKDWSDASCCLYADEELLPAGRLRERPGAALKRSGAIVVVSRSAEQQGTVSSKDQMSCFQGKPVFLFTIKPMYLQDVFSGERHSLSLLQGGSWRAVAALANNASFDDTLQSLSARIEERLFYADHHAYELRDWERISKEDCSRVVCTAKDAVKLTYFLKSPGKLFFLAESGEIGQRKSEFEQLLRQVL